MYFTQLPDHTTPGFDEQSHFQRFKKQNIIFNAVSDHSWCHNHVGCLSLKTIFSGEESYFVDGRHLPLKPGHFLILNDDQTYSCQIDRGQRTRVFSIFFQKEFAASVLENASPEFAVKLNPLTPALAQKITNLATRLDTEGYDPAQATESLIFLLTQLSETLNKESLQRQNINALKPATKKEIFKRLGIAKDILHASYSDPLDLARLSAEACLSVPQLVRQFKAAFGQTPHQYLVKLRLDHATKLLTTTKLPIKEITWRCGFLDNSAFSRAFKTAYNCTPERYRQ